MNRPARSQPEWGLASGRKVQASDDFKSVLWVQGHSGCLLWQGPWLSLKRLDAARARARAWHWGLCDTWLRQQSLRWALLPAVSSLTGMPQLTCPTTDTGLGGIHFKLSPRFPGRSLAAALPIRASGGSSDNSVLWEQSVIQTWSSNFAAVLAQVSVVSSLQSGTSYRYTVQQLHTFDIVVSKSFCHWLKSDSMWHVSISHWVSLFHIFTLNPVEIPARCIRKFQSNPFPFFQHCLYD